MTPRRYSTAWTATAVTVLGLGTVISLLVLPATNVESVAVGVLTMAFLGERLTGSGLAPVHLERFVLHVIIGVGSCLGLIGLVRLLGPGGLLPLLLLAAASPQATSWAASSVRRSRDRFTGSPATERRAPSPAPADLRVPAAVRVVAPSWTDAELCEAWRTSYLALERCQDLDRQSEVVRARQGYLDELERRHPVGFARWLYVGARPASDPSRYLSETTTNASTEAVS